jgi:DNA end-binding protein Ku
MRSIWKGSITFSLVSIPIKVFNAIETSEKISFNQLHAGDCLGPIGQKKQCKKCGLTVTNDEIVKGYQHEKEKYVVVAPEEIASITPESNEAIEIIGFIKPEEIPTAYFDASYFAAPNGPAAERSYALLREVMKRSQKVGIAKVILREPRRPDLHLSQRRWPDDPKAALPPRGTQGGRCSGSFQSSHAARQ